MKLSTKSNLCAVLASLTLGVAGSHSAIITVDNNPTHDADFTQLNAAIESASDGDVIHLIGSAIEYQAGMVTKSVQIYGPGYFLKENPNTQATPIGAQISSLTLSSGSSGSFVSGVTIRGITNIAFSTDSITLQRCYFQSTVNVSTSSINNILLQNYFARGIEIYNGASDILISNNIFASVPTRDDQFIDMNSTGANATIINNTFVKGSQIILNDSVFRNNIIVDDGVGTWEFNNTAVSNNIVSQELIVGSPESQFMVVTESPFSTESSSTDGRFMLQNAEPPPPAIGGGINGEDLGAFGGDTPYVLSGIPVIPNIYVLEIPATVTRHNGLRVRLKARTNL
jgi:hypothetical protein